MPPSAPLPSGAPASRASDGPVFAPVVWLALAALLVLGGVVLALVAHGRPFLSVLGWGLAGFGAIGSLTWFSAQDAARRADKWYSASAWPSRVRAGLALAAVLVVAANAYRFADWAGRR